MAGDWLKVESEPTARTAGVEAMKKRTLDLSRNKLKLITENGKPLAVVLELQDYRELLERLEDLEDAIELPQAVKNAEGFTTLEDFEKELASPGKRWVCTSFRLKTECGAKSKFSPGNDGEVEPGDFGTQGRTQAARGQEACLPGRMALENRPLTLADVVNSSLWGMPADSSRIPPIFFPALKVAAMPPSDVQRKLTSILCSDAAGYSRLMGENPEDTLNTLTEYREVFAESIKEYRGRIVNSPGDAILAEFASVLDTVACAVDIQQELGERNQKLPENRRMDFRIGINLGDVLVREGDIFGDGVNVAARLESLAKPGGICISGKAHEEVKKRLPLQFEFMGEQKVKNIADPVRTYRVVIKPGDLSSRAVHMERLRKFVARRGIKAAIGLIAAVLLAGGGWTAWEYFQQTEESRGSRILKFLETGKKFPVSTLPIKDTSGDPEENTFRDETTGMEFVWVSGGTFEMGCGPWNGGECEDEEKPVRPARLDGFWMARHEVTVDQYLMFFQETSGNLPVWLDETSLYHYKKGSDDHYRKLGDALSNGNYPIVGVAWHDATAFTR